MAVFTRNTLFCWTTLFASALALPLEPPGLFHDRRQAPPAYAAPVPFAMPTGTFPTASIASSGAMIQPTAMLFPSLATGTGFITAASAPTAATGTGTGADITITQVATSTVEVVPVQYGGPRQSSFQPYYPISYAPQQGQRAPANAAAASAVPSGTAVTVVASTGFAPTGTAPVMPAATGVAPSGTNPAQVTGH